MLTTGTRIVDILEKSALKFDLYCPEVTILDGKASIKEKQPYLIEIPDDPSILIVIDTRENPEPRPFTHLKDHPVGIVLLRDSLIIKNHDQVTSMNLSNFPDFVLNSRSLVDALKYYKGMLYTIMIMTVLMYYALSKLIQTLISSLAIFLIIRRLSFPLNFGHSFKLATFAIIPPTLVDLALKSLGIFNDSQSIIYLCLYAATLFLLVKDLLRQQTANMTARSQ